MLDFKEQSRLTLTVLFGILLTVKMQKNAPRPLPNRTIPLSENKTIYLLIQQDVDNFMWPVSSGIKWSLDGQHTVSTVHSWALWHALLHSAIRLKNCRYLDFQTLHQSMSLCKQLACTHVKLGMRLFPVNEVRGMICSCSGIKDMVSYNPSSLIDTLQVLQVFRWVLHYIHYFSQLRFNCNKCYSPLWFLLLCNLETGWVYCQKMCEIWPQMSVWWNSWEMMNIWLTNNLLDFSFTTPKMATPHQHPPSHEDVLSILPVCAGAAAIKFIGDQQPGYSCCTKTLPEGGRQVKTTTPLWSNKDRQREKVTDR